MVGKIVEARNENAYDTGPLNLIGLSLDSQKQPVLIEQLLEIITSNNQWLTQRAIDYAKETGYSRYTTTIWAAWEGGINELNTGLKAFFSEQSETWHLDSEIDYRNTDSLGGLVKIGQVHRAIGISFQHFLGLMKYFRLTYLDLIDNTTQKGEQRITLRAFLHSFFDKAELAICTDWAETSDDQRLEVVSKRMQSLTLEKDKYLTIFESLKEAAFVLDPQNRVINANHAANQSFGAGGEPGEIYYATQQRAACEQFDTLINDISFQNRSAQWLETRSGKRYFDIRKTPIHDPCDNTALGSVLVLHDVTDHQRAIENSRSASRLKSAFLATVSHEIRTPLSCILGASELLGSASPERQEAYLGAIEIAGQRLFSMLGQVLDYSKLEAGVFGAKIEDVNVPDYLDEFEQFASAWAISQGIDLALKIEQNVPQKLSFDRQRVHQLLTNLVSNAIKHDQSGCIDVTVHYDPHSIEKGQMRFVVEDGGTGVDPKIAESLFLPFVQADTPGAANGTGLGLAICSKLVESLGGSIGFNNRETGGARFWFEIPAKPVSMSPCPANPKIHESGKLTQRLPYAKIKSERPSSILLIDDDSISSMITTDILTDAGHQVWCADTGKEAIQLTKHHNFDLALVDYRLPDMTGPEAVKEMEQHNANKPPLVVAFSANPELVSQSGNSDLFLEVLSKPINAKTLLKSIDRFLGVQVTQQVENDTGVTYNNITPVRAALFLDTYLEDIQPFLDDLANNCGNDVVETAHRIASATITLGLNDLGEELIKLEKQIRTGNPLENGDLWALRLQPLFDNACIMLKETASSKGEM